MEGNRGCEWLWLPMSKIEKTWRGWGRYHIVVIYDTVVFIFIHSYSFIHIKSYYGKVTVAFNKLAKIWRSGQLIKNTKIRIIKPNIIAVLLYGCKTWLMTKKDEAKLDTFLHKHLWRVLKIHCWWRLPTEKWGEELRLAPSVRRLGDGGGAG